jgi:hypothetical protein
MDVDRMVDARKDDATSGNADSPPGSLATAAAPAPADTLGCFGSLAIEWRADATPALAVSAATAGALAARLAADLGKLVPEASGLDLGLVAALFDPVELLRPGWPLHAELQRLVARAPMPADGAPRLVAFGAHADALPAGLQPDPGYAGGALRLLPFVLHGDVDAMAEAGARLEQVLLDTGMAGAQTALDAQAAFGAEIEHARYLTVRDLAAMMAMQYEHAGIASVWPLVEAALLAPGEVAWLDAPPEPLVRVHGGEAQVALLDEAAWRGGGWAPAGVGEATRLARSFERFQLRQRQIAAVLEAHGIAVTYAHCPNGAAPRELLAE